MKRIIIAFIFLAISVCIGIFSQNRTERICNNMLIRIEELAKDLEETTINGNHDKKIDFYNATKNLNDSWEENSTFFYFFFNNNEIKALETNIEKLPEHAKNGEYEASYLCIIECLEELEYIKNSTKLKWDNVF